MGECWTQMDARPRASVAELKRGDLPEEPGVYAFYRGGRAVYVGKAGDLRKRVWGKHGGKGAVMTGSAFRRNVAQHLGISTANEIKKRLYQPTAEELALIRAWIESCQVAWMTRPTEALAVDLERDLKHEFKPPLTRI
jgi:hypothetical protein